MDTNKRSLNILIYGDFPQDTDIGRVGVGFPYYDYVGQFGVPIIFTEKDVLERKQELIDMADMLVVPGGADVNPARYNESTKGYTGRVNAHYEWLDLNFTQDFIDSGKMVVGICRGMQTLNVMFGGSLYQHVIGHNQTLYKGSSRKDTEQILFTPEKEEIFYINSIHHQAVKRLGNGLIPIGFTQVAPYCPSNRGKNKKESTYIDLNPYTKSMNENKVKYDQNKNRLSEVPVFVEAFKHETLPILGFQYHPEEFDCDFATAEIHRMIRDYTKGEYKKAGLKVGLSS